MEKNTTIVFPLPLEMMTIFNKMGEHASARDGWRHRRDQAGEITMRSLLDIEEEEETTAREITLSTASLLGIFFGLVLICGVFFGFGYSMGRGTGQGAQAASLGTGPAGNAAQSDETTSAANQPPEAPAAPCRIPCRLPQKPLWQFPSSLRKLMMTLPQRTQQRHRPST